MTDNDFRFRFADFLNFLRGMETWVYRDCGPLLDSFLNFLRGMETVEPHLEVRLSVLFLNFLRGMETQTALLAHFFHSLLPKLP